MGLPQGDKPSTVAAWKPVVAFAGSWTQRNRGERSQGDVAVVPLGLWRHSALHAHTDKRG
jgi:hypothetical protein